MVNDNGYVIMPVVDGKIVDDDMSFIFIQREKLEELRNLLNAVLDD